jgi:hypothetical protein
LKQFASFPTFSSLGEWTVKAVSQVTLVGFILTSFAVTRRYGRSCPVQHIWIGDLIGPMPHGRSARILARQCFLRPLRLGLDVDDRLSLGLVLGREDVQHGIVDDPRRSLCGLLGEQLNSGLGDGNGYRVDLHGNLRPKAAIGLFTLCKRIGLTGSMQNQLNAII